MTKLDCEKIIQRFCKAWLEWVDAGAPHGAIMFSKHSGLGYNLRYWMMEKGYNASDRNTVLNKMCNNFIDRFGTSAFPFSGDADFFKSEKNGGTMHLNPKRLAWAREQAAMLEKENV